MKKQYIAPELSVDIMDSEELLASSLLQLLDGDEVQEITLTEDPDEVIEFCVKEDWILL